MGYTLYITRQFDWDKLIIGISHTNEEEVTAYHEAGHCVVAERLGYRIKKAQIFWYNDQYGEFVLEFRSFLRRCLRSFIHPEESVMIIKGGDFIQKRFFPDSKILPSDTRYHLKFSTIFNVDNEKTERMLQDFFSDVNNIDAVKEIAQILIKEREICGRDVRQILCDFQIQSDRATL